MTTMRIVRQNFVSGAYYAQMRGKGGGADDPNKRLENKLMVKIITIIIKPYLKKTICSPSETPQKDRDIWR